MLDIPPYLNSLLVVGSYFASVSFGVLTILILYLVYAAYKAWIKYHALGSQQRRRSSRCDPECPSHGIPPLPALPKGKKRGSLRKFEQRTGPFKPEPYVNKHKEKKNQTTMEEEGREKLSSSSSFQIHEASTVFQQAEKLNMDHIYLDMKSFLFAYIFLGGLNLVFQASRKLFVLSVKVYLQKRGYISKPTFDNASEVAAKLALETSISVYYKHQNDDKIATFSIENFAIIPAACDELDTSKTMTFKVDLKTKRIVSSFLDDRELNDEETANLLFFHALAVIHPKVHAFSNWAVNMEEYQFKMNPFIAQNSLVTTMYNYYGYTSFVKNIPNFVYLGLISSKVGPSTIQDVFDFSMESTVPEHGSIRELAPYSRLVNFVVKLRPHFMKEFNKTKHMYFPGCHGEALFAQTVLHSLDHQNTEWIVDDPLSFGVNHPDFGIMAEFNRVVRAGFAEDLDGLLFTKSFKDSKHPFYRSIYEKARTIDQTLADHMDTCIIK